MKKLLLIVLCISNLFSTEFCSSISNRQKECLDKILYALSEKNAARLLMSAINLRSMGKELDPVPPLEFLYYILENETLIKYLQNTRQRYFQWNAFISGFADKCNRKAVYFDMKSKLEDFCEAINEKEENLRPFVLKRNWQGLVEYLINKERG